MPMEFTIDQAQLVRGLARAQSIVERRSTMPILANALIAAEGDAGGGQVELAATDLEVGVRTTVPARSVGSPGRLTLSAKKLYEIARELPPGDVHVKARENLYAEISSGKVVVNLVGLSPDEFPALPGRGDAPFTAVDREAVRSMIERTLYAASSDETRYNLNGVYLERLEEKGGAARMVATDGHRLALVDRAVEGGLEGLQRGVILPRKGLQELKRLLDEAAGEGTDGGLRVAFRENSGLFLVGETLLVMRLIEGAFPDYRSVIPRGSEDGARVDREAFARALRRISIVSAEKTRSVRLALKPGLLEVSTTNPDLGEAKEEIEVDYAGRPLTVGFNARYLLDFLGVVGADTVVLDLADETSPGLLKGVGAEGYLGVVMPMRI